MSEKHMLHHHLGLTEYVSEASHAVWNLVSQHTQAMTICFGGFGEPGTRDCSFPFLPPNFLVCSLNASTEKV